MCQKNLTLLWVLHFSEKVLMKLSELNWLIVWTTATFTLESAAQIQIQETMDWKLLSRGERRWVEARKVAHKVTSSGLLLIIWPGSFTERNPRSSSIKQLQLIVHRLVKSTSSDREVSLYIHSHMASNKFINTLNCYKLFHRAPLII